MSTRRIFALIPAIAMLTFLGVSCGGSSPSESSSSEQSSSDSSAPSSESGGATSNNNANNLLDAIAGEDADEARDAVREHVGIEGVASALERAMDADRVEVDGDTVHIYLGGDSRDSITTCLVATMTLGTFDYEPEVVLHKQGEPNHVC